MKGSVQRALSQVARSVEIEDPRQGWTCEYPMRAEHLREAVRALDAGEYYLENLTTVDWDDEGIFEIIYQFNHFETPERVALRVSVGRSQAKIPSIADIIPAADWHERESWDLFGVVFDGHPYLERLLLPEDVDFHPLRKEFARPAKRKHPGKPKSASDKKERPKPRAKAKPKSTPTAVPSAPKAIESPATQSSRGSAHPKEEPASDTSETSAPVPVAAEQTPPSLNASPAQDQQPRQEAAPQQSSATEDTATGPSLASGPVMADQEPEPAKPESTTEVAAQAPAGPEIVRRGGPREPVAPKEAPPQAPTPKEVPTHKPDGTPLTRVERAAVIRALRDGGDLPDWMKS